MRITKYLRNLIKAADNALKPFDDAAPPDFVSLPTGHQCSDAAGNSIQLPPEIFKASIDIVLTASGFNNVGAALGPLKFSVIRPTGITTHTGFMCGVSYDKTNPDTVALCEKFMQDIQAIAEVHDR